MIHSSGSLRTKQVHFSTIQERAEIIIIWQHLKELLWLAKKDLTYCVAIVFKSLWISIRVRINQWVSGFNKMSRFQVWSSIIKIVISQVKNDSYDLPDLSVTWIDFDAASIQFSIISLIAFAGRWMTSPAAILFTTTSSNCLICGIAAAILITFFPANTYCIPTSIPGQSLSFLFFLTFPLFLLFLKIHYKLKTYQILVKIP